LVFPPLALVLGGFVVDGEVAVEGALRVFVALPGCGVVLRVGGVFAKVQVSSSLPRFCPGDEDGYLGIFILSGGGIGRLIYLFARGRIMASPGILGSFRDAVVDGIAGSCFRPSSSWRMVADPSFPTSPADGGCRFSFNFIDSSSWLGMMVVAAYPQSKLGVTLTGRWWIFLGSGVRRWMAGVPMLCTLGRCRDHFVNFSSPRVLFVKDQGCLCKFQV